MVVEVPVVFRVDVSRESWPAAVREARKFVLTVGRFAAWAPGEEDDFAASFRSELVNGASVTVAPARQVVTLQSDQVHSDGDCAQLDFRGSVKGAGRKRQKNSHP